MEYQQMLPIVKEYKNYDSDLLLIHLCRCYDDKAKHNEPRLLILVMYRIC